MLRLGNLHLKQRKIQINLGWNHFNLGSILTYNIYTHCNIFWLKVCTVHVHSLLKANAPIIRNLQHPPPPHPHFLYLGSGVVREGGNLNFTCGVGWGILYPMWQVSLFFLFGGIWVVPDQWLSSKGENANSVNDWFTKKGLHKLCSVFKIYINYRKVDWMWLNQFPIIVIHLFLGRSIW